MQLRSTKGIHKQGRLNGEVEMYYKLNVHHTMKWYMNESEAVPEDDMLKIVIYTHQKKLYFEKYRKIIQI